MSCEDLTSPELSEALTAVGFGYKQPGGSLGLTIANVLHELTTRRDGPPLCDLADGYPVIQGTAACDKNPSPHWIATNYTYECCADSPVEAAGRLLLHLLNDRMWKK